MRKIILITGASRGIGAATARLAAERGYAVCVNYLTNHGAAERVVQEIAGSAGTAMAVKADVSLEEDVLRLFKAIDEKLGPLTALVNNVGIVARQTRVENMDASRVNRVFDDDSAEDRSIR